MNQATRVAQPRFLWLHCLRPLIPFPLNRLIPPTATNNVRLVALQRQRLAIDDDIPTFLTNSKNRMFFRYIKYSSIALLSGCLVDITYKVVLKEKSPLDTLYESWTQ